MTISFYQVKQTVLSMLLCATSFGTVWAGAIIPDSVFDRSLIKPRVEQMDFFVRTKYSSDIERQIRSFVLLAKGNAQRVLGNATIYFPTIEKKIKEMGLPDGLKYLTVVESMLDPRAKSYAGAGGMWQLMPFLADDYGIKMDQSRDDRFHVEKSSAAGLDYLQKLYSRFDNWELALAAYNCGPNRISKVLKQSGKRTYWAIRHLLPRQTREFVPKLIAVKYLFQFYQYHDLKPTFPSIDLQLTKSIEIDAGQSYESISTITDLKTGVISFLNPGYIYEPKSKSLGRIELVLPARVAGAFIQHQKIFEEGTNNGILYDGDSISLANPYYKEFYAIKDTMQLQAFCEMHQLSESHVWLWNELVDGQLIPGQKLFSYQYAPLKLNYRRAEQLIPVFIDSVNLYRVEHQHVDANPQNITDILTFKVTTQREIADR